MSGNSPLSYYIECKYIFCTGVTDLAVVSGIDEL